MDLHARNFINMMDNAPFIERYAVYSNVEDVRKMVNSSGALTPAGTVYRDKASRIAYSQVIPEVPTPPTAIYRFENNSLDSSAYGHSAVLQGGAKYTTGKTGRAVVMSGAAASGDHVQLSTTLGNSTDFTFGGWIYPTSSSQWQRIFDLGSSTTRYLFLTPAAGGSGNLRFAIKNGSAAEQQLNHTAPLPLDTWTHVAVTIDGNTGKLFVNGELVATNPSMTLNPVDLAISNNFLGKSQFPDPLFAGRLDGVHFLPYALTDSQVAAMQANSPPQFSRASPAPREPPTAEPSPAPRPTPDGDTIAYSKGDGPGVPAIAVNQNTATLATSLEGTYGFNKTEAGTLVLSGSNPLSGTINIDTSSTTIRIDWSGSSSISPAKISETSSRSSTTSFGNASDNSTSSIKPPPARNTRRRRTTPRGCPCSSGTPPPISRIIHSQALP